MHPEKLGRYQIVAAIGDNALGATYLGNDPLLKRKAVLQTVRVDPAVAGRSDAADQFLKDIKVVERLSHANIATVYDCGQEGDLAYIATEFLDGRDLRELIVRDQPVPAELAVDIVAGVADGLAYAHRHGVIHQNVSPAHITVLANGGVKLAGFGIAALQTGSQQADTAFQGTTAYLAPEQFSGKKADARTDIFSLAVILYQLLTGKPPFDGDNAAEVMYRIVRKPARWPSRAVRLEHRGFDFILARALAKLPDDRYPSAIEFAADLRRARELAERAPLPWPTGGLAQRKSSGSGPPGTSQDEDANGVLASLPPSRRLAFAAAGVALVAGLAFVGWNATRPPVPLPMLATPAAPAALSVAQSTPAPDQPAPGAVPAVDSAPQQAPSAPPPEIAPAAVAAAASDAPPPAPVKPAMVTLSIAPWGEVFVNNQSRGISPPLTRLELPPGPVRIEIRNTGAPTLVKELNLDAGKTVRLKHKF